MLKSLTSPPTASILFKSFISALPKQIEFDEIAKK
jgi:hypothetical protein